MQRPRKKARLRQRIWLAHGALFVMGACVSALPTLADDGPTPAETLLLEYINRARADPVADGERMASDNRRLARENVDMELFRREMARIRPAPPLVFNLDLVKAARRHSRYMILNGQGHGEDPDKPGFTGKNIRERSLAVGYRATRLAENVFLRAWNPWDAHSAFTIDWGRGPGGMQSGRGHRWAIYEPSFREFGCSFLAHDRGRPFAVTELFGTYRRRRFAGGVVYVDKNGNGFYDAHEGKGGVVVSCGESRTATWASGAYTLVLKSGSSVKMTAEIGSRIYSKAFGLGTNNVKFDVVIPAHIEYEQVDRFISAVHSIEDIPANARVRFRSLIRLHLVVRHLHLDDDRAEAIHILTEPAVRQLDRDRSAVRAALAGHGDESAYDSIKEIATRYQGTKVHRWFKEAELCARWRTKYRRLNESKAKGRATAAAPISRMARDLDRIANRLESKEWKEWMRRLVEMIEQHP